MRKLVTPAVAALLLLPASAAADGGAFRDPDEQPFCENPDDPCPDGDFMDFRRLTFGHERPARALRHGIETSKRWKTKRLGGKHGVSIYVDFNTDDDRHMERGLEIRRKDGELWAGMFRGKYHRKRVPGRVRVWRPDRRSVKVRFPKRLLGDDVDGYRWVVWRARRGVYCPGSCHTDFAPNRGTYEHRL
jgi:hypothetical protein